MASMQTARLVPVVLACLALGAHLLRSGLEALGWLIAASPLLLLTGRLWAVRGLQVLLALGALEWLRTLARLVAVRRAHGQPWGRLVAILVTVAAVTALSVHLLESWRRARERADSSGSDS